MKIAVDASALAPGSGGIGRYLRELLPRMIGLSDAHDWTLYARDAAHSVPGTRIRADGLPVHTGRIASLFTTQPCWARRDSPDLFWGPAHRLPFALPARTAAVVTIHDLCHLEAPTTMRHSTRWLDAALMPRAVRRADRVVAVSRATHAALAREFSAAANRVVVVQEGGTALPAPAPRATLPFEGAYVLCVGTIEPRKNLGRLFEAFARLDGGVRLVLAGGAGWGMESPTVLATRLGIAERVTWLGAVDDARLATLYAHAELLAMPSLYEGFGLPILEALAHGTPVVFGSNSSMPEVAGNAGLGVDAHNVDAIAAGLKRLLTERAVFAARTKTQAAKFSWDRAARETLTVFQAAVQARRADTH